MYRNASGICALPHSGREKSRRGPASALVTEHLRKDIPEECHQRERVPGCNLESNKAVEAAHSYSTAALVPILEDLR
eukprot:5512982-Amphidinium_carterae.1